MAQLEKLLNRFLSKPKDFTSNPQAAPKNTMKRYQLDFIEDELKKKEVLK